MPSLNDLDNFAGRVAYAAQTIARGKGTGRAFDNCFENWDGTAVAIAVYRRSLTNPRLERNIWRFISKDLTLADAAEHAAIKTRDLPALAAKLREAARQRNN